MKIPKKLPPECDFWCAFRHCFQKGFDKGPYVVGRGYTSYYKKPKYVCMHRLLVGCPDGPIDGRPLPEWWRIRKFSKETKPKKVRELCSHLIDLCEDLSQEYTK